MTVPPQDGWRPDHDQPAGPSQPPPTVDGLKWLLVAIAVLLVVGIIVCATLIVTRGGKGAATKPALSDSTSDIASANDTGPVSIITDEPTCQTFVGINNSLADLQAKGWGDLRSTLGPISEWTSDQRAQVDVVAEATRKAADLVVPLAMQTPHRLVRELYEQFIAYGRAYADSVPHYMPRDNELASANINVSSALLGICNAIQNGAVSRSLALDPVGPPTRVAQPGGAGAPERFIASADSSCKSWVTRLDNFNADTADWQKRDGSVPASLWTSEQRALAELTEPVIADYANGMESAGRESGNPAFEDFALAATLYVRGFVSATNSYTSADGWLNYTGFRLANLISSACSAIAS